MASNMASYSVYSDLTLEENLFNSWHKIRNQHAQQLGAPTVVDFSADAPWSPNNGDATNCNLMIIEDAQQALK